MTTTERKTIVEFELCDHGIEHEQYFQGCGLAFTDFEDVATGCGNDPREAIDDALESLAQNGWETDGMEKRILAQELPGRRAIPNTPRVLKRHGDEAHYYLSIRVKGADDKDARKLARLERKQANEDYPPLTGIGSRYHAPAPKIESLARDPSSGSGFQG